MRGYCLTCLRLVYMYNTRTESINNRQMMCGQCPRCDGAVNRIPTN